MASCQSSVWFPDLPRSSAGRSSLAPSVRDRDDTPALTQLSEEFDDSEDIIMAIDQKGKIGCCYYTYADHTLSFMEDISMPTDEIIDVLKFQVKPTILLIPSRLGDLEATTDEGRQYRVLVRPAGEFSYDAARKKLLAFHIGGDDGPGINMPEDLHDLSGDTGSRGRLFKLASWINIESRVTVGCAGAVLAYLQRKKAIEQGDGAGDRVEVAAIEMVSLKDVMFVNADTICSLQVFESEAHPSGYMAGAGKGGKEGLSLFGIMNMTRTPLGQRMLKQWFLKPSLSIDVINERQESVAVLLRPDNNHVLQNMAKSLKMVKNVPKILGQLKRGKGGAQRGGEWSALLSFVLHALKIRTAIQELGGSDRVPIVKKIMDTFPVIYLQEIGQMIMTTIDFGESEAANRVVAKSGVDADLDEMRQKYAGIGDMLSEVARQITELAAVPENIAAVLNVIYFPQIGYLTTVPAISRGQSDSPSVVTDGSGEEMQPAFVGEDWEYQFCTATTFYYKNPQMRDMDDYFGDVYGAIGEREIEIIHELQVRVLEHEKALADCVRVCSELDCLMALAESAARYKYVRPTMTAEPILEIIGGRHPLQELCVPSYIENPGHIYGGTHEGPSMILLTGPNYSGKSVYLKQTAIVTYLAHIGSFVPATSATVGITDKILTRINTRESVSKIQSAFAIDLQQVSLALRMFTEKSLLIIDEFGKGTDISSGAGLAAALFEYLLERPNPPRVVAATHFYEIFENGFLKGNPMLWCGHMRIMLDPNAQQVESQITYLYKLEKGRSMSSFGTVCAALNGVEDSVVARADELLLLQAKGEDLVAACAEGQGDEEEVKAAEEVAKRFLTVPWDEVGEAEVREWLGRVLEGMPEF